jgi:hypothetical protein
MEDDDKGSNSSKTDQTEAEEPFDPKQYLVVDEDLMGRSVVGPGAPKKKAD